MDQRTGLDRLEWRQMCRVVHMAAKPWPLGRRTYSNVIIVLMECWRVHHRKPMSWLADPSHYGGLFRPRKRPSYSQFTRRIASEECQAILQRAHDLVAKADKPVARGYIDGKPLPVSSVSKDPDARSGHITGGFAKGYKLHAYVTEDRRIPVWSLTALNVGEALVAMEFLPYLPPQLRDALNMADGNYDGSDLYKGFDRAGSALLTPLRNQHQRKGGQHHQVTLRQMGPARRAAVDMWDHHRDLAEFVLKTRNNVEGVFSVLTVAMDLHLPGHVRRLARVRRYVGVTIMLYHARLLAQEELAGAA